MLHLEFQADGGACALPQRLAYQLGVWHGMHVLLLQGQQVLVHFRPPTLLHLATCPQPR